MKRDYELIKDGKYNMRAIMQLAWAYMRQNKSLKSYTFKSALKSAWVDASLKMDEVKAYNNPKYSDYPKPATLSIHEIGYAMLGNRYEAIDHSATGRW